MGELDIRLALSQIRIRLEDTEATERELVEWLRDWHKASRPRESRAEKAAGKMATVSGIFTRCQP